MNDDFTSFPGTGEIHDLLRAYDWPNSKLGSPDIWPASLRTAVSIVLDSTLAMWVCWGPELLLIYNDGYAKMLGEKHPGILSRPYSEVGPEAWAYLGPIVAEILAGKSIFFEDAGMQLKRNGSVEDVWFTYSLSPLRDEHGKIEGLFGTAIETTTHVLMQRRYTEERHRKLIESLDQAFCLIEVLFDERKVALDYRFIEVNAQLERHTGLGPDCVGKTALELVPTLDREWIRRYGEVALTGKSIQFTDEAAAIGRWFDVNAISMGGDNNHTVAVFLRDVTAQRKADEELHTLAVQLADASRRKDEFLAMLAHELRNPLAPIGAAAELLQIAKLDEAQVRKTSQIIGRQVRHMTSLVDDLLDVSRVTRGLVELNNTKLDVTHVITEAIEQMTPLISSRMQHLTMQLAAQASLVMGDKKRLVQVIANILSNAAKYTREGGQILIRTEVRNAHVLIQVIDDGIGMAPEFVSHVFDLFAQAERTSDRSSGGLGLGLSLVKSLVTLHGGTVTGESAGLDKGSMFSVCLPRVLSEHETGRDVDLSPTGGMHVKPRRIMVVDDNVDAASMLSMLLEAEGHEVIVEHGAHQALERAKTDPPQVFLLDIGLPEIDGNELAHRLRRQPETAQAVLIAVTGYGQDRDREQTSAAGFDHHLVKPVDYRRLTAILAEISNS
jgi:PAS domain S-box-containing protein